MAQNRQLQKLTNPQLTRIRHRRYTNPANPRFAARHPAYDNFLTREATRANVTPLRLASLAVAVAGTGYRTGDQFQITGGTGTITGVGQVKQAPELATGTLTMGLNVVATETVTLGAVTYTFVAALAAANDVLVGATIADSIANLVAAINGAAGEGSVYGTGTVANPEATALGASPTMVATAIEKFEAGEIASTETGANMDWDDTTLLFGQVSSVGLLDPGEYTVAPGLAAATTTYKLPNGRTGGTGLTVDANVLTGAVAGVTEAELWAGLEGVTNLAGDPAITRARHFRDPRNTDATYTDNGVPVV